MQAATDARGISWKLPPRNNVQLTTRAFQGRETKRPARLRRAQTSAAQAVVCGSHPFSLQAVPSRSCKGTLSKP